MSSRGLNPRLINCQLGEAGCLGAKVIPVEWREQLEEPACQRFSSTPPSCSFTETRNNGSIFTSAAVFLVSQCGPCPSPACQRVSSGCRRQKTLTSLRPMCKKPQQMSSEALVGWIINKAKLFASRDLINQTIKINSLHTEVKYKRFYSIWEIQSSTAAPFILSFVHKH